MPNVLRRQPVVCCRSWVAKSVSGRSSVAVMIVVFQRIQFLVNKLGRVAGLIWLAGGCKISNLFNAAANLLKRNA